MLLVCRLILLTRVRPAGPAPMMAMPRRVVVVEEDEEEGDMVVWCDCFVSVVWRSLLWI